MGTLDDLEKLRQLKESGALTDVEFEIEKQKLLNSNTANIDNTTNENSTNANYNNTSSKEKNFAITGFVLGMVSIIAWLLPLAGYPVTILGIIFSTKGLKSTARTMALLGLIFSIIFLVFTLGNSIAGVITMTATRSLLYY